MTENLSYHPLPQPDELSRKEKDDAMGAYLMMFASLAVGLPLPVFNLIAAIVYLYMNRTSRFVRFHALQSLYSQLPVTLLNIALWVWVIVFLWIRQYPADETFWGFLVMVVILNIAYFAFSIFAAVRAYAGRMIYFLFFGKIAYHQAFRTFPEKKDRDRTLNMPPI